MAFVKKRNGADRLASAERGQPKSSNIASLKYM